MKKIILLIALAVTVGQANQCLKYSDITIKNYEERHMYVKNEMYLEAKQSAKQVMYWGIKASVACSSSDNSMDADLAKEMDILVENSKSMVKAVEELEELKQKKRLVQYKQALQ